MDFFALAKLNEGRRSSAGLTGMKRSQSGNTLNKSNRHSGKVRCGDCFFILRFGFGPGARAPLSRGIGAFSPESAPRRRRGCHGT